MKIIAVSTAKGGVGKSFTTLSLAVEFSLRGLGPVLVVDLDSSRNSTDTLLSEADLKKATTTLMDVMANKNVDVFDAIHSASDQCKFPGVSVLVGDKGMDRLDSALKGRKAVETVLKKSLATTADRYNIVLLDCPPTKSLVVDNALCAATDGGVLSPMSCDDHAINGALIVQGMLAELIHELDITPPIYLGAFFTNFDRANSKGTQAVLENAKSVLGNTFIEEVRTPSSTAVREAVSHCATLQHDRSHPVAVAYRRLADFIVARLDISKNLKGVANG